MDPTPDPADDPHAGRKLRALLVLIAAVRYVSGQGFFGPLQQQDFWLAVDRIINPPAPDPTPAPAPAPSCP